MRIRNPFAVGGGGAPVAKAATVPAAAGAVYSISRLLGSTSTLALASGTNSNLTLSGTTISATAAIAAGTSQTAIVRESTAAGLAMEYPVVISVAAGAQSAPTVTTVPLLAVGTGDSILGGSGPYMPGFNRAAGNINGTLRYINKGRPGQYSQVVYNNFAADVLALSPDIITIEVGTNDRSGGVQTIQAGTGNVGNAVYYIRKMITDALAALPNVKIVVESINFKADGSTKANDAWLMAQVQADIAGAYSGNGQVRYSNTSSVMSDPSTGLPLSAGLFQADNVHPTGLGGRLMGAKLYADMVGFGLFQDAVYPWGRNQSTSDARNLFGATAGTLQGTPSAGVANGWTWTAGDGLTTPSVVAAPSGFVGNAQRLTIGAGAAAGSSTVQKNGASLASYIGRRIAIIAKTTASGFEANGASALVKLYLNGSYVTVAPMNAASTFGYTTFDGNMLHYGEITVPANTTTCNVSLISGGNPGAAAATIDLYDIIIIPLN